MSRTIRDKPGGHREGYTSITKVYRRYDRDAILRQSYARALADAYAEMNEDEED